MILSDHQNKKFERDMTENQEKQGYFSQLIENFHPIENFNANYKLLKYEFSGAYSQRKEVITR